MNMHQQQHFQQAAYDTMLDQNVRIIRLHVFQSGTHNDPFVRNVGTNLTPMASANIMRQIEINYNNPVGGVGIGADGAIGMGASVLLPEQTMITPASSIPGGWQTPRFRFVLEIESKRAVRVINNYTFHGYTDGFTFSTTTGGLNIDPSTRFYINSYYLSVSTIENGGIHQEQRNAGQLVNMSNLNNMLGAPGATPVTPDSILLTVANAQLAATIGQETDEPIQIIDSRITSPNGVNNVRAIPRQHSLPTHYISNMIDSYVNSDAEVAYNESGNLLGDIKSAAGHAARSIMTQTTQIENNPFLFVLNQINGNVGYGITTAEFSYRDLMVLDNEIANKTHYHPPRQEELSNMPSAGRFEFWNTTAVETQYANALSTIIPAIMHQYGLSNIAFSATNDVSKMTSGTGISGSDQVFIGDLGFNIARNSYLVSGQPELNDGRMVYIAKLAKAAIEKALQDLFTDLGNIMHLYSLYVKCVTHGDIMISISVDGGPNIDYGSLVAADSLWSPMVAPTFSNLATSAQVWGDMFKHISEFNPMRNRPQ